MTSTQSPFPLPKFPVYGASGGIGGGRWVDNWNQAGGIGRGPLWQLVLGHGERAGTPLLMVITDGKVRAYRAAGNRTLGTGPSSVADAAATALLHMHTVLSTRSGDELDARSRTEAARKISSLADHLGPPEWLAATLTVDGSPVEFMTQSRGDCWVAAADLGHVAMAAFGDHVTMSNIALRAINERLNEYGIPA